MSKRVLGRSLDDLMQGQDVSPLLRRGGGTPLGIGPAPEKASTAEDAGRLDRGFETLVRSGMAARLSADDSGSVVASDGTRPLEIWRRVYLIGCDLLLLGVAAWVMNRGDGNISGWQVGFAALAVAVGAVASIAAWLPAGTGREPENAEWISFLSETGKRYLLHTRTPVFLGELVESSGQEPQIIPLWIGPNGGPPGLAVEQFLNKLKGVPAAEAVPEPVRLRQVLVKA